MEGNAADLLGPEGQSLAALGLDGVVTRGPTLGLAVRCDPDVFEGEAAARLQQAAGRRQHHRRRICHQLVRHWLACSSAHVFLIVIARHGTAVALPVQRHCYCHQRKNTLA